MSNSLAVAAGGLLKREQPKLVAATGLIFQKLFDFSKTCSLASILESYRGGVWGKENTSGNGYPVLRSTNMRGVRIDVTEPAWCDISSSHAEPCALETGDILIIKSSGSSDLVGKAALFIHPQDDKIYLFSNFVMRIRPNQTIALPDFVAWFLRSPQSLMWRYKTQQNAVGLRNLDTKAFLEQNIPLPSLPLQKAIVKYLYALEEGRGSVFEIELPSLLNEQRQIVARIEELATKIEEARGLRREAVEEEKILLSSAVTQVLRSIRCECEEVTVESVALSVTDGDHQPPPKADSGIPFIFINHIIGGNIDFSGCKWVPPRYFESLSANRVPKRGDVLYTAVGSYGVPCLVNTDEPFCFQRHIAIIKPNQSRIVPAYLTWALSSSDVFDQATKVATGSAQLTVPLRGIRNLKFTLPSLKRQQQIVAFLDNLKSKVDSLKLLQSETSAELDALLPSILDKAFKGELS